MIEDVLPRQLQTFSHGTHMKTIQQRHTTEVLPLQRLHAVTLSPATSSSELCWQQGPTGSLPTGFLLIASHFSHADNLPQVRLRCGRVLTDDSTGQHSQTQLLSQFSILSTV